MTEEGGEGRPLPNLRRPLLSDVGAAHTWHWNKISDSSPLSCCPRCSSVHLLLSRETKAQDSSWLGPDLLSSDSTQFQYLQRLFIQSSPCLWPGRWDSSAEDVKDCGRRLGYPQAGSEQGCLHQLPYTDTQWRQEWQGEACQICFPFSVWTFYFPNGLRSDRNTTRHAGSLSVEGLQCVLWAPESLICMEVHRTISPCNTLQRRKNQCPTAHKDEYRAFQLSFLFSKNISLFKWIQKAIWYCFHFSLRRCWVYARISTSSIPLGNGPLGKSGIDPWKHSRLIKLSLRAQWMKMRYLRQIDLSV